MRASVLLVLVLSAAVQGISAAVSFKDALQRAKEEAWHITSSLQDKERVQAKLKAIHRDVQDLYTLAMTEVQRVAEPYLHAGQQSWAHFRVRTLTASSRAESWLREQHQRAVELHWAAVDALHGHISAAISSPKGAASGAGAGAGVNIERKHVAVGLLAVYSGAAAVVLSLLLRRAF